MTKYNQSDWLKNILEIPAETQTIEFKRLSEDKVVTKIVETVVAMTNTDGGVIILGIDDPEKTKLKGFDRIYGIDENIPIYDALGRELQRIIPPLSDLWPPTLLDVPDNQKRVAVIFVLKAIDNFRSVNNHVYVRGEKGNRQLTSHEVVKFAYAKGFERADKELVSIDFSLLKTPYFEEWKEARRVNGGSIENIGETPNLIGVPKTIQGALIRQIKDAHEYVLMLLRSGIRIPSGFKTIYQIPERAVKEAITNAVIHRDYHMKRDIEVKIYEDRVEVDSPGLFPYNITRTNIGWVRAEGYRNDLLVKHLREFPSPPNLDQNEGVRAMRSEMAAQNLYPPVFLTYPLYQDFVQVVLLNEYRPSEWEKISSYLKENKYITNEKSREVTGVVQRDKMAKILKNWAKQGLLIQIVPPSGYFKGTKYKLPRFSGG